MLKALLLLIISGQAFSNSLSSEWYNYARFREIQTSLIDPRNRFLERENLTATSDFRLDYTAQPHDNFKFVLRPKIEFQSTQFEYKNPSEKTSESKLNAKFFEAYSEWQTSDSSKFTLGLQNYQWGPAEFISPSNPIYHFNSEQRNYYYKDLGRFLIRSNITFNPSWTLVMMIEPINNGEPHWMYGETFSAKALAKLEYRSQTSLTYVGIDGGMTDRSLPFYGGYANFELFEGFSAYADARFTNGSVVYAPETMSPLPNMVLVDERNTVEDLAVMGLRFEDYVDVRAEYIYNSLGYDKSEFQAAYASLIPQNPRALENLRKLEKPGLELLGQHYTYYSIRKINFILQDLNFSVSYLHSHMDHSGSIQSNLDVALGDFVVLFAGGGFTRGDSTQELSAQEKYYALLGAKVVW